nr:MerR family transcriptional regulator [Streptomyces zagrosensis]
MEDLAHRSGATVRTIRAYQDRGLLPRPERRGRANVYGDEHLARLQQIAALLERGYTLSSIKELLEAWDAGRDLGGVLGLVAEVEGPWTDEKAVRISRAELSERFGGNPGEAAVSEAVELGILELVSDCPDEFLVPSPQELAVAAELHTAGVPLPAIADHVRELRGQVEHIAGRFLDFTTEHVFQQYLGHPPTDAEAEEAAFLIRRFRPLAQQTIDAELARAMRTVATRHLHHHLGQFTQLARGETDPPDPAQPNLPPAAPLPCAPTSSNTTRLAAPPMPTPALPAPSVPVPSIPVPSIPVPSIPVPSVPAPPQTPGQEMEPSQVALPAQTLRAVRELVGSENMAAFIAGAVEREVWARRMDRLTTHSPTPQDTDDLPSSANVSSSADLPSSADVPGTTDVPGTDI